MKKLIYVAAAVTSLVAGFSSCKKDSFNINQNPNQATDSTVSYDVILPAALNTTGNLVRNPYGFLQNWMGFWARSGTYAPNVIEETYNIPTTFGNAIWNTAYNNNYDYQIMQIKAKQEGATMYEAIARIMKAHNFQVLVDVYGNIPYSQALKGNAAPTPKYDNGMDVYKDLLRQLDTAINLISVANQDANRNILDYDIMFGTSQFPSTTFATQQTMWTRFANTLKLRILVHLMNGGVNTPAATVSGFDIPGEFAKLAASSAGFLGVGQDAQVNPGYKSDKPNPFYTTYKTTTTGAQAANNVYYRANKWGIDYYAYNGDPRISRVYEAGNNGLVGVQYGLPPVTANASPNLAGIGPGVYKSATASNPIITAGESFFLQAEARQRGFLTTGASAATLLNTGITENFRYLGASNASGYISGNAGYADVDITAPTATPSGGTPGGGVFTIVSQKWFGLNGINPLEVWNDYRRVDMLNAAGTNVGHFIYGAPVGYTAGPPLSVSPQRPAANTIPIRLLYPQTEYNYNAANVGAQGSINQFTSRIFWDIR
jgi:hypothetical protein